MKVAVIQHRLCSHERMDLAAMLALAQEASDEGASVIACPRLPDAAGDPRVYEAFLENARSHAPGTLVIMPSVSGGRGDEPEAFMTPLGRTMALYGDECIDPRALARAADGGVEAMVWQPAAETPAQAEAFLEFALDASLTVAGIVLVTAMVGKARGISRFGCSAVVRLGDILAEAGADEEVVLADMALPAGLPEQAVRRRPDLPPVLAHRLSQHSAQHPRDIEAAGTD